MVTPVPQKRRLNVTWSGAFAPIFLVFMINVARAVGDYAPGTGVWRVPAAALVDTFLNPFWIAVWFGLAWLLAKWQGRKTEKDATRRP